MLAAEKKRHEKKNEENGKVSSLFRHRNGLDCVEKAFLIIARRIMEIITTALAHYIFALLVPTHHLPM